MRTSLNKIQAIEEFISGTMASEDQLVLEAQQLVDRMLASEVSLQRATYRVITAYNRAQLKDELNALHQRLLSDPARKTFWDQILSIF